MFLEHGLCGLHLEQGEFGLLIKWEKIPDKMEQYVQLTGTGSLLGRGRHVWRVTHTYTHVCVCVQYVYMIGKMVWE